MPRQRPEDHPGAWWHVTNRGVSKRPIFENGHDVERFLALLSDSVARGTIEVHAFCVLITHFHLLIRSPLGGLPRALHWILLQYSRWFNRSRKRDGSLFRGRYRAQRIDDSVYWTNTLRYIDL